MIAKRATVRENFFTQKKKNAKLSNEDAENRPLIANNIEFDFCAKYKLDRGCIEIYLWAELSLSPPAPGTN